MQGLRWVQLTDEEIDDFLGRGGTGVISFGTEDDEPPASIPVSYGYNATDRAFYFNLSFPPGSRKDGLVDEPVSYVVHEEADGGWRSVVATGRLTDVSEMPYASDAIQGMWAIEIPIVDVFDRPRREISFQHYLLVPDSLSGRKEVPTDD
ncbi:pyridoxamine 5'-phosphate oxidase family protein [Halovivax cerinus]|uniref:Pyridoxamine 5'-phosphate oxidase family protein n=1 Tax=Halovivax cerinus TaxID=1487865 RepID=A0ABD5NS94_9EURY|nr:pyridoxamine 5'-phosphate oxidase family protein [Halovivax cerinus]